MKSNNGLLCLLLLGPGVSCAEEWQFNGFISQGLVAVDGSEFFTGKDDTSLELTEATLMASWRPWENLRFAGALSYRQRGTLIDEHLQADYLFLEYLSPIESGFLGMRLGRVKNEVGFFSSTRDVPFSRPGILLPQSIYADYYRDTQLHINGGEILGRHHLADGELAWHLTGGVLNITDDLTRNTIGTLDFGTLDSDYFYSIDLDYSTDSLRLGANVYQTLLTYDSGLPGAFAELELLTWVLSAQYRVGELELTSEFSQGERTLRGTPLAGWQQEQPYRGYYVDARYGLSDTLDIFVRYDYSVENLDDPDGKLLAEGGIPAYFGYARDWTLGGRWRFADNWLLSAEYHWVEGASWVPPILNKDPMTQDEHWSVLALEVSYRMQW